MIRKFLKKLLPKPKEVRDQVKYPWLNRFIHDPFLWHINRRSVSGGMAIGLFIAFVPLPFQMLIATIFAIIFRVNVPVAIIATWITNPFTFIPINYAIYKVGHLIIGNGEIAIHHIGPCHFYWDRYAEMVKQFYGCVQSLGKSYLIGLPIVATSVALIGFAVTRLIWRIAVSTYKYRKKNK